MKKNINKNNIIILNIISNKILLLINKIILINN